MTIFQPTKYNIARAAELIKNGELVSFPTETVYGLGADTFNKEAVARIFEVKQRPYFDPVIVHVSDKSKVSILAKKLDAAAQKLINTFWPGPLTVILEKHESVPDIVTAGLSTVGIRMPDHPVALELIKTAGTPVAAPSANRFGSLSPTTPVHVLNQLGTCCSMILDGGNSSIGVESTIVKTGERETHILRPGGISVEEIREAIGEVTITDKPGSVEAPGQMPWHYAPSIPVMIAETFESIDPNRTDAGYLLFKKPDSWHPEERTEILSPVGNLREAAANLFSCLHRLDSMNIKIIIAEPVPETGLGLAIMDRLRKASKKA